MDNFYTLVVDSSEEGERIDSYISSYIDTVSRSRIAKLIKDGNVSVNTGDTSKVITKPSFCIKANDSIVLNIPPLEEPTIEAEDIPLDILYEDNDVIVVNKPKGMVVHPAAGHYSGTLVNALMYHCKGSLSGINGVLRPGIVHRIDKDTSGSLIVCKNDNAHNSIALQLKEHSIDRIYRAIVHGRFSEPEGTVDAPIGRHPNDRLKMAINSNGKRAVTHYKVLEELGNYSYMEFKLETGRTHQIRVHMASINHPLVGDEVYGRGKEGFKTEGQVLHAMKLGFIHPVSSEKIDVYAPIPEYFEKLIIKLR